MKTYSSRLWLNPEGHPHTGSFSAYDGPYITMGGDTVRSTFIEIGDCATKARLHPHGNDLVCFLEKLKLLRSGLDGMIEHLESEMENENK
jgi:hypothetical protein